MAQIDVIRSIVAGMEPITLEEMDSVKLMNRIDTKFVTSMSCLSAFLALAARAGYRVACIDGERICGYDTTYYDTPDCRMYIDHHNRRLVRRKVRVRTYLGSGITFLEVKNKNNHGRTSKKRVSCSAQAPFSSNEDFLEKVAHYRPEDLSPALRTRFSRITLVSPQLSERLTIDMDLCFDNFRSGAESSLKDAVIIELKQDGRCASSAREMLLEKRIFPLKVSKYCIGTALTCPLIKQNRFKIKIRSIEKIIDKPLI